MDYTAFLDEIFRACIDNYSQMVASFLDPFFTLFLSGVTYIVNSVLGMPLDIPESYLAFIWLTFASLGIFLAGKLMLMISGTRDVTMMTFVQVSKAVSCLMMAYATLVNISDIHYICSKYRPALESFHKRMSFEEASFFYSYVLGILVAVFVFAAGFLITETLYGLQIRQLSYAYIPFTSFFFEVFSGMFVLASFLFAFAFPGLSLVFNAFIVALCLLICRSSVRSIIYFDEIYIFSLYNILFKNRRQIEDSRIPKRVKELFRKEEFDNTPFVSFPIFIFDGKAYPFVKHERIYVNVKDKKVCMLSLSFLGKNVEKYEIDTALRPIFFTENHRCLELFTLDGPIENINHLFKKPKKDFSFVVSRLYEQDFKRIEEMLGATDFAKLKTEIKDNSSAKAGIIDKNI